MSLSAPVTVQVREYIDPTIGVATLDVTLTVMVGAGDEEIYIILKNINNNIIINLKPQIITHSAQ